MNLFASVPASRAVHRDASRSWGMVMSWKQVLLICLIVGLAVIVSTERHFFRQVFFVIDHVIAAASAHTPVLLHFISGLVR